MFVEPGNKPASLLMAFLFAAAFGGMSWAAFAESGTARGWAVLIGVGAGTFAYLCAYRGGINSEDDD
jgi:quinol-cytochrome oxidoreductase complex cytochrome b subunit